MSSSGRIDPIDDDELLYRRIPVSQGWYNPGECEHPHPKAFNPLEHDTSGLSVSRQRFKSIEEASKGLSPKGYYVAILKAGELRHAGIEVVPKPLLEDPGHAELPSLTYENRRSDQSLTAMARLAEQLCISVEGPFIDGCRSES